MGWTECLNIIFVAGLGGLLSLGAPLGYSVYKVGVKATTSYIIGMPTRIVGYVLTAYASKVTTVFAFATALGGTIKALTTATASQEGLFTVAGVFLREVYRETLSATGLISSGFQQLTNFLVNNGVCGKLVNLDMIGYGLFNIWRGAAIIIVLLKIWGYYRSRGRKTEVDFDEKILVIALLFSSTALINVITTGAESAGIVELYNNATQFFDALSSTINGNTTQPVNQSLNQSLNQSASSTLANSTK